MLNSMSMFLNVADFVQKLKISIPSIKWFGKIDFWNNWQALNKIQCFSMV